MTRVSELGEVSMNKIQNLLDSLNSNNFSRIRSALRKTSVDLNYRDPLSDSETILMRICRLDVPSNSRCEIIRMVLDLPDQQVDVNAQDGGGLSAIAHACRLGDEGLVRLLASEENIDPNQEDTDGNTPLIHACCTGNAGVVAMLIDCFGTSVLDVNQPNYQGMTPLMEAARLGYTDVCRILVSQGQADVSIRSKTNNFTAKDYATEHGRCNTPDLLLLDLVAQRKVRARQARKAMGRSILNDLCPEIRLQKLGLSATRVITPFEQSAKQIRHLPLSKEYIEQMNSIVFQVSRHVERLPEDLDGEKRECLENSEAIQIEAAKKHRTRRLSNVSLPDKLPKQRQRRGSLPVAVGSGRSLLNPDDLVSFRDRDIPRSPSSERNFRLPLVAKTTKGIPQNLSTSANSPSYRKELTIPPTSGGGSRSPTSPTRTSPTRTPPTRTSPRRSSRGTVPTIQVQAKTHSRIGGGSESGRWKGKSSTSVPSYLFR